MIDLLEIEIPKLGGCFRSVWDWHADVEPGDFIQAKISWEEINEAEEEAYQSGEHEIAHFKNLYDTQIMCQGCVLQIIGELKNLRARPKLYRKDDGATETEQSVVQVSVSPTVTTTVTDHPPVETTTAAGLPAPATKTVSPVSRKTTNYLLQKELEKDPTFAEKTAEQMGIAVDRSKTAVVGSKFWRNLNKVKELAKIGRAEIDQHKTA